MPCAIPPLDQTVVEVGRGYGEGWNRERTDSHQLHAGMDFVASSGTPVLAPIPGVVDFLTSNTGSRISADAARGGATGQVRRMGGYGTAIVVRHDFAVPGLPTPFYTSYNHLSAIASGIVPGVAIATGQLLGNVGNTTNGQFPGMGSHLHMEVRRVPFPGPVGHDGYELDTMDPSILFTALGIDWVDSHREVGRNVGGHLLIRADGPSGPASCPSTAAGLAFPYIPGIGIPGIPLLGLGDYLGEFGLGVVPAGYVDPLTIKPTYSRKGTTQAPRPGSPAADVVPPSYDPAREAAVPPAPSGSSSFGGGALLVSGGITAAFVIAAMRKKGR